MKTILAEQPVTASIMLGVLAAGLIYAWLQTGKRQAGWAGLFFLLLIPGSWVLASMWETDRERIEAAIYDVADAVEKNDPDRAVRIIADERTAARAKQELEQWVFEMARVNKIRDIQFIEGTYPPRADVELSVTVRVSGKRGNIQNVTVPRRLILKFEKNDRGQWQVIDYSHGPLVGPPDRYSTPAAP